jgi:hypothetical protein
MDELTTTMALAGFGLTGLAILIFAGLRGWQGWLDLKRLELGARQAGQGRSGVGERIEVADLRERIRKLESIAACIDL